MNIQEVRTKFPQYNDLSDGELATALHKKFYSDMPYEDFAGKIGLKAEKESGVSGVAAEASKGLLRGASDVALMAPKVAGTMLLGPIWSSLISRGVERLAAPSRELVKAAPATSTEQFAGTAGEIAGAGAVGGGLGSLRAAAGNVIAGLGGAAGEQAGGDIGRLAGTLAPGVAGAGLAAAKSRLAARTAPNIEAFRAVGAQPSAGQATENVFLHGLENLAAKFPGGSGVMKAFIDRQQQDIGRLARTRVPGEAAGRAIETGITRSGGFLERSKQVWRELDDAIAAKVSPQSAFAPANTVRALDELTSPVSGAERTTAALVNPKISEVRTNLAADLEASGGVIPFGALRALRSKIGSMLDDALVTGIPGGQLKKVYGALSKDLEAAANSAGAGREFARQNNFYRARMERIEGVLDRVIGKNKQPEDIFKAINPTDPDQANKLRAVMRSLEPAERKVVSDAVVNRLGRATPGKQDEFGALFSSETFLTNWNKLSSGAKSQLFPDLTTRNNMDAIARVSANLRQGRGIYSNPSGTAGSFAAYSVYASPIASIASGSLVPVGLAGGAAGTAYLGAKMLTSPAVVNWLATPIRPNSAQASAHLARLYTLYQDSEPELKEELARFIQSIRANQ